MWSDLIRFNPVRCRDPQVDFLTTASFQYWSENMLPHISWLNFRNDSRLLGVKDHYWVLPMIFCSTCLKLMTEIRKRVSCILGSQRSSLSRPMGSFTQAIWPPGNWAQIFSEDLLVFVSLQGCFQLKEKERQRAEPNVSRQQISSKWNEHIAQICENKWSHSENNENSYEMRHQSEGQ